MKKFIPILMLVCLLCSFAACGQQDAVAIITPEPVSAQSGDAAAQSQVAVPEMAPADQTAQGNNHSDAADTDQDRREDAGNDYSDSSSTTDSGSNSDNLSSADKLSIAQGYIGSSLGALQGAIGYPNSSEYVISCIEDASQEGLLYYDGFVVWTVQYSDGSEIVKGIS